MLIRLITICSDQRQVGARLPDQPAQDDVVGERQRRRPDPDHEIGPGRARDALAAAHQLECDCGERHLQRDQRGPDQAGDDEAAHQDRGVFLRLAGALRLRGEGQRAHAQEGEQPEQAIEDHRGHRDPAEQRGIVEAADRGGRDDADQRRGQIGDHRRSGDGEHLAGRDLWMNGRVHGKVAGNVSFYRVVRRASMGDCCEQCGGEGRGCLTEMRRQNTTTMPSLAIV